MRQGKDWQAEEDGRNPGTMAGTRETISFHTELLRGAAVGYLEGPAAERAGKVWHPYSPQPPQTRTEEGNVHGRRRRDERNPGTGIRTHYRDL